MNNIKKTHKNKIEVPIPILIGNTYTNIEKIRK